MKQLSLRRGKKNRLQYCYGIRKTIWQGFVLNEVLVTQQLSCSSFNPPDLILNSHLASRFLRCLPLQLRTQTHAHTTSEFLFFNSFPPQLCNRSLAAITEFAFSASPAYPATPNQSFWKEANNWATMPSSHVQLFLPKSDLNTPACQFWSHNYSPLTVWNTSHKKLRSVSYINLY